MSQRSRGISLPELSIQHPSFDPTEFSADKKKGATDEAGRPKDKVMQAIAQGRAMPKARVESEIASLFQAKDGTDVKRIRAIIADRLGKANNAADLITETLTLTPAMAEFILSEHNKGNRGIRTARVAEFARIIRSGEWRVTSQGISFSVEGRLNDGQHRLSGIARGGRPVSIRATFGEASDAFKVLDTHKVRGGSDTLHVAGYKNTSVLASAGRLLAIVESGNPWSNITIGNAALEKLIEEHPSLEEATTVGGRVAKKFRCSNGGTTLAFYLINKHSPRASRLPEFADRLIDAVGQGPRSPILVLRDGLQTKAIDAHLRSAGNRGVAQAAAIIKAWNAWVSGRKGIGIRWEVGETFPLPV